MLVLAGLHAARPEDGTAEDREECREQRQAGQQHQEDADGECGTHALVQPELRQRQGNERGDDGERGERDRFADAGHRALDRLVWRQPVPQLLANAEDEEDAIVRPGPQDQHDQDELGDPRDLDAELRGLGDDGTGQHQDERRWNQGQDRSEEGAEGQHQQDDDEQERVALGPILRSARRLDRVDLRRQLARQVNHQAGIRAGRDERRAHVVDELVTLATAAELRNVGFDQQLAGRAVGRDAQVDHRDDVRQRPDVRRDLVDRDVVRGRQPTRAGGDHGGRRQARVLERGGHLGRLHAGQMRGQEPAGRVLRDARERGQELHGEDGDQDPGGHDEEAETNVEPAQDLEETAHEAPRS